MTRRARIRHRRDEAIAAVVAAARRGAWPRRDDVSPYGDGIVGEDHDRATRQHWIVARGAVHAIIPWPSTVETPT